MDKKKKDDIDYAAAYRQFMNFGHGRSLKQFCEASAMDYAFMFSAIESCDINRLSPEAYLRKFILGLHEKKVEKKQLLPCYIRL